MKRAPWLYTLMQIALWSIHGVLISYAQRYLAGMGMRDSAIGLLLGGATAAGFVLQPLLAAVCDRSRLTVRLTLLTGGGLMLLCCAALLPAAKSLTLTAAFYAVACCMAQTVPSFVNALGMAAERKGMRLNFGISRGAGSIGFGLAAAVRPVFHASAAVDARSARNGRVLSGPVHADGRLRPLYRQLGILCQRDHPRAGRRQGTELPWRGWSDRRGRRERARRRAARRLGRAAAADGLHDCFRRRCGHRVVRRADKKSTPPAEFDRLRRQNVL
ncbi:MAG: MFS transporter [Oscillospiraceae bacterium]